MPIVGNNNGVRTGACKHVFGKHREDGAEGVRAKPFTKLRLIRAERALRNAFPMLPEPADAND